jgi:hypothetical protein
MNSKKENKRIGFFELLKVKQTKRFLKNCFGEGLNAVYNFSFSFLFVYSLFSFPFSLLSEQFVFCKKLENHTRFKQANNIWFLGKNNFEYFSFCRDLFLLW